MKKSLSLVRIDTEYCNYLRKYDEKIAKRCCDFKLLEEKCQEYKELLSTNDK